MKSVDIVVERSSRKKMKTSSSNLATVCIGIIVLKFSEATKDFGKVENRVKRQLEQD